MHSAALRPILLVALALVLLASPAAFASCETDCKCFTPCSQFCTIAGHASNCRTYGICNGACLAPRPPSSQATPVSDPLISILDTTSSSCASLPTVEATHASAGAR
jgi:hypothetical protein